MLNQYYSFLAKKFQDWVIQKQVTPGDRFFALLDEQKDVDALYDTFKNLTMPGKVDALMLDLRTDFSLPCKLIAEEHFLYDSIFTRI